VTNLGKNPED